MRRRGPNMSLLTANLTYQDSLRSVRWDLMPSTGIVAAVIRKLLLRPRTFVLRTWTNENASSCAKLYCRVVPRTRANQNKASSTKIYFKTIPRTWTNWVLRRKTSQNTLIRNKKTQGIRLHMVCLILTSLTYFHAEETTLTCHTNKHTWPLNERNTLQICLTIWKNIIIVTAKYFPVKSSNKLF